MFNGHRVVAIVPALDEASSISRVVSALLTSAENGARLVDWVIVCDNGSIDATATIARTAGATVVCEPQRGYGAACLAGLAHYRQTGSKEDDVVVFVDADRSVRIDQLPSLLEPLSRGADLVIGNRNDGHCARGALTPQQRFGNWLATALIRLLWQCEVHDLGPFRAIRAGALWQLDMRDRAFGWTCEMQIRAIQEGLVMTEVPVDSLRRIGRSKISGTLLGSLRAGKGILGMVFNLWRRERRSSFLRTERLES